MKSMLEFLFSSEIIVPGNWTEERHLGSDLEEITKLRSQIRELLEQEHLSLWETYQEKAQALENRECRAEFERGFLMAGKLALEIGHRMYEERN